MKRISIFILVVMMTVSCIGCRRKENKPMAPETTPPAIQETKPTSTTATTEPIIETNIPDPTVDSNSNSPEDNTTESSDVTETEGVNSNNEETAQSRRMFR